MKPLEIFTLKYKFLIMLFNVMINNLVLYLLKIMFNVDDSNCELNKLIIKILFIELLRQINTKKMKWNNYKIQ